MNKKGIKKVVVTTLVAALGVSTISYGNLPPLVYAENEQGLTKKVDGMVIENGILKKYEGDAADIVIPEGVVTIGEYAFEYKECIKNVTIPKTVTKIDSYAFFKCKNLEKVDNKGNIDTIGNVAFSMCEKLSNIDLSKVKHIGSAAFNGCKSLKELKMDAVQSLSGFGGSGIEKAELNFIGEDSCIDYGTFEECKDLKEVTIKGNLSKIEDEAFLRCKALKSIQIEDKSKITYIGGGVFEQTPWLSEQLEKAENKMLIINDILVKYQPNVFYAGEYDGILDGEFSSKEEEINKKTISNFAYTPPTNVKMETVTIPNTVKAIAGEAFYGAYSVEKVNFDSQIKTLEIGSAAFDFTTWEKEYLEKEDFLIIGGILVKANCNAQAIEVPNGVRKIVFNAFMINCFSGKTPGKDIVKVKQILFPQSVEEIVGGLFFDCEPEKIIYPTALKKKMFPPDTKRFPSNVEFKDVDAAIDAKDLLKGYEPGGTSDPAATATTKPSATPEVKETLAPSPTQKGTAAPPSKVTNTPTMAPTSTSTVTPPSKATPTVTPPSKATPTAAPPSKATPAVAPTSKVTPTVAPTKIVVTDNPPKETQKPTPSNSATPAPIVKPKVKKASISKWKNASAKKIKVTVKKSEKVKGYQYVISTNKKFKKKVRKINSKKNVIVIGNLKRKTTYYLKVRAYKLDVMGKKVYGKYSNIKKIKR